MTCRGRHGDYYCPAWRAKARVIRRRDAFRCHDCGRKARLEVHHLYYAVPAGGPCGRCVLLGVPDRALISLCGDCHDIRHGRKPARAPAALAGLDVTPIRFILSKIRRLF